eukprot:405015-Pleurochrysis_carterae.AAC.1
MAVVESFTGFPGLVVRVSEPSENPNFLTRLSLPTIPVFLTLRTRFSTPAIPVFFTQPFSEPGKQHVNKPFTPEHFALEWSEPIAAMRMTQ